VETDRFLDVKAVRELTSLSRTEVYRRMKIGRFPRNIKLSRFRVAWLESEVRAWMAEQVRAARA
jgi:prophage regulatory protein